MSTLTIELNEQLVQEYEAMSERERLDIRSVLRTVLVDEIQKKRKRTVKDMFDLAEKMSAEAERNGLTEALLAEILEEIDTERPR